MKHSIKSLLATLVVSLSLVAPVMAEPIEPASVRVIDGDTIAVDGHKPNIRLVVSLPLKTGPLCAGNKESKRWPGSVTQTKIY